MSQYILQAMKDKMAKSLENMTFDNYTKTKMHISEQFRTMDALKILNDYEEANGLQDPLPVETSDKIQNDNAEQKKINGVEQETTESAEATGKTEPVVETTKQKPKTNNHPENTYTFERMLRGGLLSEIEAFVPEGIVRSMDIQHGDRLTAEKIENSDRKYNYEVVDRMNAMPHPEREQFNLCQVERDGNFLCVTKSLETGKLIRIDDTPQKIIINNEDYTKFSLKEGDLVDIAFYKGSAHEAKVIWRHDAVQIPSIPSPKTDNPKKKPEKTKIEDTDRPLNNVNVCIIGESHKESIYRNAIEKAGGQLFMTDGKNKTMQIKAQVKRADIVVCLVGKTSHNGMDTAKEQAKELNVPFLTTWSLSANTVVKTIAEHLNAEQSA